MADPDASTSLPSILDLPVLLGTPSGNFEALTMRSLDTYYQYSLKVSMIYASQLGASLLLLLAMCITTPRQRLRTPMFHLNALALLLNTLRLLLALLYFTSPLNETYIHFSSDTSAVPRGQFATQVAATLMATLLLAAVLAALVVQAAVVLVTAPSGWRYGMLAASGGLALLALGVRVALAVVNVKAILGGRPDTGIAEIVRASSVVTAVAVCWFSVLFTAKLGHTVLRRFRMGIRKFGKMEVLLIMGGQTLIVPAIFAIVQFLPTDLPVMDSNVLTVVTLFLPLSSLWAGSIVDGQRAASAQLEMHTVAATGAAMSGNTSLSRRPLIAQPRAAVNRGNARAGSELGEKSDLSYSLDV